MWTDLFQHVDRFVDGDRNARMRLDAAPWTWSKALRRAFKWTIYLVIGFWTGGAWIMYFADAPTLVHDFWRGEAAPVAYITVAVLTLTTVTLGGFMREQVCIYMCPWPRIQSAMMDEKSLTVTYKDWRGEPRGSLKKAQKDPEHFGDCVDCLQCVAVCPTGIDIREGPQIGCITCALCIDACDRTMAEVGRPRGLIDYARWRTAEREAAGEAPRPVWKALLRPRTLIYLGIWSADRPGHAVRPRHAQPDRHLRRARPQSALHAAERRQRPQFLHGQAAQHEHRAAADGSDARRPARSGDVERARRAARPLAREHRDDGTRRRDGAAAPVHRRPATGPASSDSRFHLVTLDEQAERDTAKVTFSGPGAGG